MLLRQDRGGHQIHDLSPLLHSLECCPDRNLGLTEAHITAYQSVHDAVRLHIAFSRFYRTDLILCFLIWEKLLELSLPHSVRTVLVSVQTLSGCIQLYQILGYLIYSLADLGGGLCPLFGTQLVELRRFC